MAAQLGEHNVFMDVELAPGVDFVERITDAVGGCHVLLVIIGPQWATLSNGGAAPRIAQPDDFVRLEVETALRRDDVTVIPVLVGGARMPDPGELPDSVRALARRNALELSDMRWRTDIQRLVDRLNELLAGTTGMHQLPAQEKPPREAPSQTHTWAQVISTGTLVALVSGVAGYWLADMVTVQQGEASKATPFVETILRGGLGLAVVGGAVAIWLALASGERGAEVARLAVIGVIVGALGGALGGAIWGSRFFLDHPIEHGVIQALSVGSAAVAGAVLGGLIAGLWTPHRVAVGFAAGIAAGALVRQAVFTLGWNVNSTAERVEINVIAVALITMLVLAFLVALDAAERTRSTRHAPLLRG
jgi:hypothetical protein